jgi:hypothetical protein
MDWGRRSCCAIGCDNYVKAGDGRLCWKHTEEESDKDV